jgi:hypothetical protein
MPVHRAKNDIPFGVFVYVAMDPLPQTLDDFPLMAAEVMITAPDAWQLAQVWLNMRAHLRLVGAQSERVRRD